MNQANPSNDEGLNFRPDAARRPKFFSEESDSDRLLAIISALAGELAVLRARVDTHERLAAQKGVFDRDAVENYEADATAQTERQQDNQQLIQRVFRPLSAELSIIAKDDGVRAALRQQVGRKP